MDQQELRKRNTDCVYFLASPLTCKKGLECEYRHSEMARLNPTDCRYWLDRGCSNLACAFRHPPLEGCKGAEAESAEPPYGVTQPVNKKNVACYYFFNYFFCKNGDRCQFLHGDDASTHDWIPSKALSGANDAVAPEKKIITGSNSELTPVKTRLSISGTTPAGAADTHHKPKKAFQQSAPNNIVSRSENIPSDGLDSLVPVQGYIQNIYQTVTDQSSDGDLEGVMEKEEWLELSPGVDVLVGGKSQNVGYENDADYSFGIGRENGGNNVELMGYGYDEDGMKYDPEYPELGVQYKEQIHDSYDGLDTISEDSRDGSVIHISSRKRKSMQMGPTSNGRREVDLRDLLKKRRMTIDHDGRNFTRRNESTRLIVQGREFERSRWNVYNEFRRAHITRQHLKEKRHAKKHLFSSEPSSRSAPRERRSTEKSNTFTGPKTLDQIKEEKKKIQENGNSSGVMGHSVSNRAAPKGFQGPNPLNELLKDIRRLGSVVSRSNNSS